MSNSDTRRQAIPVDLANHAKGIAVRPIDYQVVDVAVNLNEGMNAFIEEFFESVSLRLNQQGANVVPFTVIELRKYVVTLVKSRVMYVRNERGFPLHYSDRVAVPAFLSFVLSGLGRVELPDLGIELLPAFIPEESMTREEAIQFGNKLKPLSRLGFEFAEGYARDKTGALDLMVLQLVEGQIVSHTDKGHPAYAVAAYFLGLLQVVNLLGPRVLYGTKEQMRMILRMVASE